MIRAGEAREPSTWCWSASPTLTESQAQLRNRSSAHLYPAIMCGRHRHRQHPVRVVIPEGHQDLRGHERRAALEPRRILICRLHLRARLLVPGGGIRAADGARAPPLHPQPARPRLVDRTQLRAPIFGELVRMLAWSRFGKTLATLLPAASRCSPRWRSSRNIVNNTLLAEVIDKRADAIREGESIAAPLKRSGSSRRSSIT